MPRKSSTRDHDASKARWSRTNKGDSVQPTAAARWEASLSAAKGQEHVYSMAATYRIGDIVLHEQFGNIAIAMIGRKMQRCLAGAVSG